MAWTSRTCIRSRACTCPRASDWHGKYNDGGDESATRKGNARETIQAETRGCSRYGIYDGISGGFYVMDRHAGVTVRLVFGCCHEIGKGNEHLTKRRI